MAQLLLNKYTKESLDALDSSSLGVVLLLGEPGAGFIYAARYLVEKSTTESFDKLASLGRVQTLNGTIVGIDAIRQIIKDISIIRDAKLFYIIENTDSLGHEAQNALLKSLEQLPDNIHFILTAAHQTKVLPTIRSRSTSIYIKPLTLAEAKRYFKASPEVEVEKYWQMSGGLAEQLHQLVQQEDTQLGDAFRQAKQFLSLPAYDRLIFIDSLAKDREALALLISSLAKLLQILSSGAAQRNDASLLRILGARKNLLYLSSAIEANSSTKLVALQLATSLGV